MSVRLKFALTLAGAFAYVAIALAVLVAGVRSDLPAGDRAALDRVLRDEAALVVTAGVLFLIGLGLLVALAFRLYVIPPRRLAEEARLIASANPAHRVTARGPSEHRRLAAAINELAGRSQDAQEDVATQIEAARSDLERERNRLAALMAELTLAVLVCNLDGRILLYNDAAKQLLGRGDDTSGLVGLGRSVFGILDRSLLDHALERLRHEAEAGGAPPVLRLTASAAAGQLLRVGVAPVGSAGEDLTGFVLSLEDVTRAAELGGHRDALLRTLTEGTRASVATIRAAVESMLDYPDLAAAERRRFEAVIRDEAVALGERVEAAVREHAGHLRAQWSLEEVLGRDLLAALQFRLESELVVAAEDAADDLWLEVDSYAVVQAAGHLAGRLRADTGVEHVDLDLRAVGGHARLGLGWEGEALAEETLRAWASEPLRDGGGIVPTVRDVVETHAGELWSENDPETGGAWVCLALPLAATAPRARRGPAATPGAPAEGRPEFYDFDLFARAQEAPGWDDRRLDALAYTVFDTETTGLSPLAGDEIVSVGAVRIVNGRLLRRETFDRLVDPRRSIPRASVAVHGISRELVRGQPGIEVVLPAFASFAEDTVLVGHNVGFDLRFIELKEAKTGVRLTQPVLDTLLLSAVVHPGHEDHSLEAMAARLGVSVIGRHTALGDAILTGEVFLGQLRLLAAQGITTLGDARAAARETYAARVSESLYSRA